MASGFDSTRSQCTTGSKFNVPSATAVTEEMQSYFSEIEDPRVQRTRAHSLIDILIIGSCHDGTSATPMEQNYP